MSPHQSVLGECICGQCHPPRLPLSRRKRRRFKKINIYVSWARSPLGEVKEEDVDSLYRRCYNSLGQRPISDVNCQNEINNRETFDGSKTDWFESLLRSSLIDKIVILISDTYVRVWNKEYTDEDSKDGELELTLLEKLQIKMRVAKRQQDVLLVKVSPGYLSQGKLGELPAFLQGLPIYEITDRSQWEKFARHLFVRCSPSEASERWRSEQSMHWEAGRRYVESRHTPAPHLRQS